MNGNRRNSKTERERESRLHSLKIKMEEKRKMVGQWLWLS